MPSFLSKLFRKKKGDEASTNASKGSSKKSRKSSKKKGNKVDKVSTPDPAPQDVVKPSQAQNLRRPSNGTSNISSNSGSEPHVRVLSPRNQVPNLMDRDQADLAIQSMGSGSAHQAKPTSVNMGGGSNWVGPVDLDESDLGSDTDENQVQSRKPKVANEQSMAQPAPQRLSVEKLNRFDREQ